MHSHLNVKLGDVAQVLLQRMFEICNVTCLKI